MRRTDRGAGPARQGGWVGLVMVLLALVVVAWLARDALRAYGLSGATSAAGERAGAGPSAERPPPGDAGTGSTPPARATTLERAREVEATLQREADQRARRINDAAK